MEPTKCPNDGSALILTRTKTQLVCTKPDCDYFYSLTNETPVTTTLTVTKPVTAPKKVKATKMAKKAPKIAPVTTPAVAPAPTPSPGLAIQPTFTIEDNVAMPTGLGARSVYPFPQMKPGQSFQVRGEKAIANVRNAAQKYSGAHPEFKFSTRAVGEVEGDNIYRIWRR